MKRNVLLITNGEKDLTGIGADRQVPTDARHSNFEILNLALDDIDLAIVDIGTSISSLAIVETLSHRNPAPPIIALADGRDAAGPETLLHHGATVCLKKPFSADELARIIQVVCASQEPASNAV